MRPRRQRGDKAFNFDIYEEFDVEAGKVGDVYLAIDKIIQDLNDIAHRVNLLKDNRKVSKELSNRIIEAIRELSALKKDLPDQEEKRTLDTFIDKLRRRSVDLPQPLIRRESNAVTENKQDSPASTSKTLPLTQEVLIPVDDIFQFDTYKKYNLESGKVGFTYLAIDTTIKNIDSMNKQNKLNPTNLSEAINKLASLNKLLPKTVQPILETYLADLRIHKTKLENTNTPVVTKDKKESSKIPENPYAITFKKVAVPEKREVDTRELWTKDIIRGYEIEQKEKEHDKYVSEKMLEFDKEAAIEKLIDLGKIIKTFIKDTNQIKDSHLKLYLEKHSDMLLDKLAKWEKDIKDSSTSKYVMELSNNVFEPYSQSLPILLELILSAAICTNKYPDDKLSVKIKEDIISAYKKKVVFDHGNEPFCTLYEALKTISEMKQSTFSLQSSPKNVIQTNVKNTLAVPDIRLAYETFQEEKLQANKSTK